MAPAAGERAASTADALLDALLDALPDGLIVCDRYLAPCRAGAAARWLVAAPGVYTREPAAAHVQEVAAAALDRGGVASLTFGAGPRRWEMRAAPLRGDGAGAVVLVHLLGESDDQRCDAVLWAVHDLKAPVHAIAGFAKLLERDEGTRLDAHHQTMVGLVSAETERLRGLIERLVGVVRLGGAAPAGPSIATSASSVVGTAGASLTATSDTGVTGVASMAGMVGVAGELSVTGAHVTAPPAEGACRLSAVAAGAISRLAGAAAVRRVELRLEIGSEREVSMPADEATTVIENLLTNALAVAPPESVVMVTVALNASGGVRCTVADGGPGIPPSAAERIFEPYVQLSTTGVAGGTGLGLAICRSLVAARGGTITAASLPAGGSVFTFDLPATNEQASGWPEVRLAPVQSHAALAAARVLLDTHAGVPWRIVAWHGGVLHVELEARRAAAEAVAARMAAQSTLACWL